MPDLAADFWAKSLDSGIVEACVTTHQPLLVKKGTTPHDFHLKMAKARTWLTISGPNRSTAVLMKLLERLTSLFLSTSETSSGWSGGGDPSGDSFTIPYL